MKSKTFLTFFILFWLLVLAGIFLFQKGYSNEKFEIVHVLIIILLVGFALFVGIKKLTAEKRGQPAEDELSRKLLKNAAATSYYISLYLWVLLIYINSERDIDTEALLSSGIIAMAIIFAVCWIFYKIRGIRDA